MSFADLEVRATAAVFKRLVNATVTFPPVADADPVVADVVFDAALGTIDDNGIQTLQPSFMATAEVASLAAADMTLTLDAAPLSIVAAPYKVRAVIPQAEGAMSRVILARAA